MTFVVDTSKSPYALLRPVSLHDVKVSGFLGKYRAKVINVSIPTQFELLESTGRLDNFRRASGKIKKDFQGFFFNDSDVYKWLEAASYVLPEGDTKLFENVNLAINEIRDAQESDGYLDTYFMFERKPLRWTNLKDLHELYCAGHLIQAAIAHKRNSGEGILFNIAKRFADNIANTFGLNKKEGTSGHPEVEMALVELYRETRNRKYLDLAKFFLDERGKGLVGRDEYHIDHLPFTQLKEVTGHAVRMLYLLSGATDIYLETGDESIFATLNRLWDDLVFKKMYITGGVGSRYEGESIGQAYELPNRRAYTETCAAIGNFMWNWRMLLATGNGKYADLMEQTLYNGLLSGISLDGRNYFYVNPLEGIGNHRRQPWYEVACCPPNLARTLASIQNYIYTVSDAGIWIHLYEESNAKIKLFDQDISISQKTNYPWDGKVKIDVSTDLSKEFTLFLRIPGWTNGNFEVKINGERIDHSTQNGYMKIKRNWKGNNSVEIELPMKVKMIKSHPFVRENTDKVAIVRGPIVYCAEAADNSGFDVWNLVVKNKKIQEDQMDDFVMLKGNGFCRIDEWKMLYKEKNKASEYKAVGFKLIPYHRWANRQPGPMAVWLLNRKG
jgi:DUF1680 family protein